jgi:4-hydroxybenzoate polyprenyltransferase
MTLTACFGGEIAMERWHVPEPMQPGPGSTVADAVPGNWVDTLAPAAWRPYLRLARADRPIGGWLLFWPCAWSLALANLAEGRAFPHLWHLALFLIGAFVMRSAGCAWNDIVDRDIDARVERTRSRPIPSGQISVRQALAFGIGCCLIGLAVLLQFNWFAVALGVASLGPVAIYPFMKRITNWPQIVLGLTFKWGALMGWAVTSGRLDWAALVLYAACIAWTLGYDTIYAHQDREDDALLGLGSTALRLGPATRTWLAGFYGAMLGGLVLAGWLAGAGVIYVWMLGAVALHLLWQVATIDIDDPANCLDRFRANHGLGALVLAAIMADMLVRWLVA